jgi:exo-beta-1,3-glucanase (GH17 family)
MKATYTLAVAALLQLAFAQPHNHHRHLHEKREVMTAWVTVDAPDAVVYVDANGVPYKTEYGSSPAPTPAPAAVDANPNPAAVPTPAAAPPAPAPAPAPPAVKPPPAAAPAPAPEAQGADGGPVEANSRYASEAAGVSRSNGYGISWTPFNGDETTTTCKTQDQANSEFAKIASMQFTSVRIYGTPCNQVELAMRAAQANGVQLMLGVFDLNNAAADTQELVRQVQDSGVSWGLVHTISIGNEDVEKGAASPAQVIAAVGTARGILRGSGFQGNIVHVDTMGAILGNPELCGDAAGDYVAANIHPFFSSGTPARHAGRFVAQQIGALRACSTTQNRKRKDHRVVVTETGWPTNGAPNGLAIPGRLQQFAAIASIKRHIPNDVYLYSAFNNFWLKNNAGTFGAEHYWGLLDN